MPVKQELKEKFERLESETVSDSFGAAAINGRAPVFAFKPIMMWFDTEIDNLEEPLFSDLIQLKNSMTTRGYKYTLECLGRFAFCIELTNLSITSTKMKTRWVSGMITKTRPGTFENYEGEFAPSHDERSNTFENCYLIFSKCVSLLKESDQHKLVMENLSYNKNRGTPYEAVFTYTNPVLDVVHDVHNICLVTLDNINWLVKARPIIQPIIGLDSNGDKTKINEKIATKCYKTDRSQTGEVQTNRAKRWECLEADFQHATLEQCWSVERKLLADLSCFEGFPIDTKQSLIDLGLINDNQKNTLCPITFQPMLYTDFQGGAAHGESKFQVGHMDPLKSGGSHEGSNIEWISYNGNRIQGSLSVGETRAMLINIFNKMRENNLIEH